MSLFNDLPVAYVCVFVPKAMKQKTSTPKCTVRATNGKQQAFDAGKLYTQAKAQDNLELLES